MVQKIQPNAEIEIDTDGWHEWKEIKYSCPSCKRRIKMDVVGCAECGIFFDWSKHASIETTYNVIWK